MPPSPPHQPRHTGNLKPGGTKPKPLMLRFTFTHIAMIVCILLILLYVVIAIGPSTFLKNLYVHAPS